MLALALELEYPTNNHVQNDIQISQLATTMNSHMSI